MMLSHGKKNVKVIKFFGGSVKTFLKIFFSRARNVFDSVLGIFFFFFTCKNIFLCVILM